VLGYLLAGFIVGPFLLPRFSIEDARTVRLLADLGLVLLLFAMGLKLGWQRLRRIGFAVALIGVVEIAIV
jgi:CPA2 family monovalent cation:H+ antiporter-2